MKGPDQLQFFKGQVDFQNANFLPGGTVDFGKAEFNGGAVNFGKVLFIGSQVGFGKTEFKGG